MLAFNPTGVYVCGVETCLSTEMVTRRTKRDHQAELRAQKSCSTNCPLRTTYFWIAIPMIRCSFQEKNLPELTQK